MTTRTTASSESLQATTQQYRREGYFIIPAALTPEECDVLKVEAVELLAGDEKSVLVAVSARSQRYRQLSEDPRILDRLTPLMPGGITFQSDKFVYKNSGQRYPTPWHTDNQYWANRRPKLSVWIPLDDVSATNGTLKIVPGSHLKQWRQVRVEGEETRGEFKKRIDETQIPEDQVFVCEVTRGSLVFFSDALLHASTPNECGRDRYAIISTYHETQVPENEAIGPATKVLTRA